MWMSQRLSQQEILDVMDGECSEQYEYFRILPLFALHRVIYIYTHTPTFTCIHLCRVCLGVGVVPEQPQAMTKN